MACGGTLTLALAVALALDAASAGPITAILPLSSVLPRAAHAIVAGAARAAAAHCGGGTRPIQHPAATWGGGGSHDG
eukprot:gene16513-2457_t